MIDEKGFHDWLSVRRGEGWLIFPVTGKRIRYTMAHQKSGVEYTTADYGSVQEAHEDLHEWWRVKSYAAQQSVADGGLECAVCCRAGVHSATTRDTKDGLMCEDHYLAFCKKATLDAIHEKTLTCERCGDRIDRLTSPVYESKSTGHLFHRGCAGEAMHADSLAPNAINAPAHYTSGGIETIDFIEAKNLNFRLGNVIKYITRADLKGSPVDDLKKAAWYLQREISVREAKP